MDLGKRLQELRREKGLSQEALAERLGVTRQAVSKWETGESLPDVYRLAQLSELFGVTTDYLIKGVPPETAPPANPGPEDAAPSAPEPAPYTAAEPRPRVPRRAQMAVGWSLSGLGALGLLIIWVLSTMIVSYHQVQEQTGPNSFEVWDVPGYSFDGFIAQYNLQALLGICVSLLIAGAALLLWRWYKLRQMHK